MRKVGLDGRQEKKKQKSVFLEEGIKSVGLKTRKSKA